MLNLIKLRQQLLSGNLPTDEFRELKLKATAQIDTGNNMLSLDMVVRDDAGDIIDFGSISTTQLYELHCKAVERIKQSTVSTRNGTVASRNRNSKNFTTISHNFLVSVNSVQCKFTDDMEFLFTLYTLEAGQVVQLTESYLVSWGKDDAYKDLKLLFTDMSTEDINRSKIFLVAFMVRIGAMDARVPDSTQPLNAKRPFLGFPMPGKLDRRESTQSLNVIDHLRRPFGVAVLDLTPIKSNPNDFDNSIDMNIHLQDKDCLDAFLRRVLLNRENREQLADTRTINVNVEMLHGDIKQIKEDYAHIVRNVNGVTSFARKMGFPEVILPGDVRNDLYLTLVGADLAKCVRRGENNIEVHVSVCKGNGDVVPGAISKGGGAPLENEYRSIVYAHEEHPKWNETIKVSFNSFFLLLTRVLTFRYDFRSFSQSRISNIVTSNSFSSIVTVMRPKTKAINRSHSLMSN